MAFDTGCLENGLDVGLESRWTDPVGPQFWELGATPGDDNRQETDRQSLETSQA